MAEREKLKSMSLGDHLEELRARMILGLVGLAAGFIIGLVAGKVFVRIILLPYENAIRSVGQAPALQVIEVAENFTVYMKASFVLGLILSAPWLFYQAWAFVSAGLYSREKRFVKTVAPVSAGLFIIGVLFFLVIIAPWVFQFFVSFKLGVDYIRYQPSLTKYVNFILTLAVVFGLAFQSPIGIVFAERMGLVSVRTLCRVRKYVFLGAFVVGAVLTPPDAVSQICLAIPLYILYEASIVFCRIWKRKRQT